MDHSILDRGVAPLDVVYPCGTGSQWADNELRYSLRSLTANLDGYGKVWLIGAKPEWAWRVRHIPVPDVYKNSHANTCLKALVAAECPEVSDPFLWMNDDFYFLVPTDARVLRAYTCGMLPWQTVKHSGAYRKQIERTLQLLKLRRFGVHSYEGHYPLPIHKEPFLRAIRAFPWANPVKGEGLLWRSIYGNAARLNGPPMEDRKVYGPAGDDPEYVAAVTAEAWCVSSDRKIGTAMKAFLAAKFPDPSRYEREGGGE